MGQSNAPAAAMESSPRDAGVSYSGRDIPGAVQEDETMSRRRQIYEGKAKILYEGPEPGTLIQYFKDDATAFNAQKRGTINGDRKSVV